MADWLAIKAEYCSTNISYRKIAEKYGISFNTLKDRAIREGWKEQRDTTHNKIATTTQQKIVVKVSNHEADRLTRLLGVGDLLADKLEQSAKQLGTYTILKRKGERVVEDDEGNRRVVEDTEEIAVPCESIINTADAKRLASALKDLNDVAKVADTGNDASLSKARELLEGLPSAID